MISRRRLLGALAAVVLAGGLARRSLAAEGRNINAFNARSVSSALGALEVEDRDGGDDGGIVIDAPDVAENGANVPVEITWPAQAGIVRLLVLGERNVFPLLADITVFPAALPWIELKVKLAETSRVRVLAVDGQGRVWGASRQVRVIVGGCLPG